MSDTILQHCKHIYMYICVLMCVSIFPISVYAQKDVTPLQDSIAPPQDSVNDTIVSVPTDSSSVDARIMAIKQRMDSLNSAALIDSTAIAVDSLQVQKNATSTFNPDGMRAVWLSALFPGLGQIYNRRYWKLPIVVGGFMGLVYATSWNGRMYADYQQAYLDVMDTDPTTNSYMNFFPSYYKEEDIDKTWLKNVLKNRKDSYRHYRDYCIVGMVALYLVCILDAYVDAELYNFDMSPDLAIVVKPAIIPVTSSIEHSALGLHCAITF